jgi:putative membrane protein
MSFSHQSHDLSKKERVFLFLKGMAMGAADSVPGISGGTIAFISGIYEELINSIQSINLQALMCLFQKGPTAAWQKVNGNFLLTLVAGIFLSLILFANTVTFLLESYPRFLMSFFVGLILASSWFIFSEIKRMHAGILLLVLLGSALSIGLSLLPEVSREPSLLYLFFCGAIAICAMILPGISGAFILILLGVYSDVLEAVTTFDILTLGVFMLGCGSGLIVFSNFLAYLFSHYRIHTLAFLLGVLLGSLYTIWPGRVEELESTQSINQLLICFLLAAFGFMLVYGLEHLADNTKDS